MRRTNLNSPKNARPSALALRRASITWNLILYEASMASLLSTDSCNLFCDEITGDGFRPVYLVKPVRRCWIAPRLGGSYQNISNPGTWPIQLNLGNEGRSCDILANNLSLSTVDFRLLRNAKHPSRPAHFHMPWSSESLWTLLLGP